MCFFWPNKVSAMMWICTLIQQYHLPWLLGLGNMVLDRESLIQFLKCWANACWLQPMNRIWLMKGWHQLLYARLWFLWTWHGELRFGFDLFAWSTWKIVGSLSALDRSSMFWDSHLYSSFLWMFNTLIQMIVQICTFCEYRSERNSLGNCRCLFWAGIRCVRITDIGLKALAQHCSLLQLLRYSIGSISVCQWWLLGQEDSI
jgi:hypothetical protein